MIRIATQAYSYFELTEDEMGNFDYTDKELEDFLVERVLMLQRVDARINGLPDGRPQPAPMDAATADDINRQLAESGAYDEQPPAQVVSPPPQSAPPQASGPGHPTQADNDEQPEKDFWKRLPGETYEANNIQWLKVTNNKGKFVLFDQDEHDSQWKEDKRARFTYKYPGWELEKFERYLPNDYNQTIVGHAWPLTEAVGVRSIVLAKGFRPKADPNRMFYNTDIDAVWPMSDAFPDDVDSPEIPF